jgi:hypothetical protein
MPTVELSDTEWQQLINILGTTKEHPWVMTNPLLMKIGQQLNNAQQIGGRARQQTIEETRAGITPEGNGKEVRHE